MTPKQPKLFILDIDGTLIRGREVLPGIPEAVARLRAAANVRFVTNNSSVTAQDLATKLTSLGIPADSSECLSSAEATAKFCRERGFPSALVVGSPALKSSLGLPEGDDAVVVGICREITYELLTQALQAIQRGAEFIATNRDATYPLEGGLFAPGAGSMVAAIEAASGVTPVVIGKPEPTMILQVMESAGATPEDTYVIGDRIETDIDAGRRAGCHTALVLTGATPAPVPGLECYLSLVEFVDRLGI